MTEAGLQHEIDAAIARLDRALGRGGDVTHAEIEAAAKAVVSVRDLVIRQVREGRADRARLDRANALVSLAYGAEFPLSGLHFDRLRQTRDALRSL